MRRNKCLSRQIDLYILETLPCTPLLCSSSVSHWRVMIKKKLKHMERDYVFFLSLYKIIPLLWTHYPVLFHWSTVIQTKTDSRKIEFQTLFWTCRFKPLRSSGDATHPSLDVKNFIKIRTRYKKVSADIIYGGKMSTCIEIYNALSTECFAARCKCQYAIQTKCRK